MPLETGTYISDLVATNPANTDGSGQGDDHLRLIKSCLLATFPSVTGAVTLTHTEINAHETRLDAIEADYVKKDGTVTMTGALNMGTHKITAVDTPTVGTDAVNMTYADLKIAKSTLTTRGDLITASAASTPARLAIGTNGQVLKSDGTDPSWADPTGLISAASDTVAGKVELATVAETQTGTDATRAVTPDGMQGALLFSKGFESADQTGWAINSVVSVAHGLGTTPKFWHITFKCLTAELGYSIGDELYIDLMNVSNNRGNMYAANATNLYCIIQNATIDVTRLDTTAMAALTPANWAIVFRAWA